MSHAEKFAAHVARRERERAAIVKVTWRRVSVTTGGGWSGLGPDGALVWVRPGSPEGRDIGFSYGFLRETGKRRYAGTASTLARAKKAAAELFQTDEPTSDERCPCGAGSLHVPSGNSIPYACPAYQSSVPSDCQKCPFRKAPRAHERSTMTTAVESIIPTAESLAEGFAQVSQPGKAPYARLRVGGDVGGTTLAYASTRKDGVLLDFATKVVEGCPQKFQKALDTHGSRSTMRVTAKNAGLARELLERLAKA